MRWTIFSWKPLTLMLLLAIGCAPGEFSEEKASSNPDEPLDVSRYLLAAEPAGAQGILALRQESPTAAEVVVVGRVGGSKDPFVPDRAAFTIVDSSLKPCNEGSSMDCPWPWDYCCEPKETLTRGTLLIKFTDEDGKTLPNRANFLGQLHVEPLNTVYVRGQPQLDPDGHLMAVIAQQVFVRPAATPVSQKAAKP